MTLIGTEPPVWRTGNVSCSPPLGRMQPGLMAIPSAVLTVPAEESGNSHAACSVLVGSQGLFSSTTSPGLVKFWLSAGRGGFGLSNRECLAPSFFVLATSSVCPQGMDRTEVSVIRSRTPVATLCSIHSAHLTQASRLVSIGKHWQGDQL